MSEDAIMKMIGKIEEKEQIEMLDKKTKTPKKKTEKPKKKRPINWKAVEKNIEKYDGLSKVKKKKADKTWGRTIKFWRKALRYHNRGLSDSKAIEKAKES